MDTIEPIEPGTTNDEEKRVWCWRLDQLVRVGYATPDAVAIAGDSKIDLSLARRLVALGCPADLATRILL